MATAYERILESRKKFEEQAGLTEQDYEAARQYALHHQNGEQLARNVETARNNLISTPRSNITQQHKALNDFNAAIKRFDTFLSLEKYNCHIFFTL